MEQADALKPQIVLTINARGELVGDLSAIPADTLETMRTPEARERMRAMYRKEFGTGRREMRRALQMRQAAPTPGQTTIAAVFGATRDQRGLRPLGMSRQEFRQLRRQYLRKQIQAIAREQNVAN